MAYATIAGLPVQVGLYTALVPLLAYALLGHSRALSVSTTSTLAALTARGRRERGRRRADRAIAAASTLAMLTGVLLSAAVAAAARLHRRVHLASRAGRLQGGTGLLIAVRPVRQGARHRGRGRQLLREGLVGARNLGEISWPTAALSAATVALLLAIKRWAPAVPGALVAVGAGIAIGAAGLLDVALTGDVPGGLPTADRARPRPDRAAAARGRRRRADVVRRVDRGRAGGRAHGRAGARRRPRAARARRGQPRRRRVPDAAGRRRAVADRRQRRRGRGDEGGGRDQRRSSRCSRCCSSRDCSPISPRPRSVRSCSSRRSAWSRSRRCARSARSTAPARPRAAHARVGARARRPRRACWLACWPRC